MEVTASVTDERPRPWSRRSPRALRPGMLAGAHVRCGSRGWRRRLPLHANALAATFRRDAPARCGAFGDERRIVAGGAFADERRGVAGDAGPFREAGARTDDAF